MANGDRCTWICRWTTTLALFLGISCVSAVEPEITPPRNEDLEGVVKPLGGMTPGEYYSYCLATVLRSVTGAPDTRQDSMTYVLRALRGEEAQLLRCLYWVGESEPALRKELVRQFLCESKDFPTEEALSARLFEMCEDYSEEARNERRGEINLAYREIQEEMARRSDEPRLEGTDGPFPEFEDIMSSSSLMYTDLHMMSPSDRLRRYNTLPARSMKMEGDLEKGNFYILLWLAESDPEIQRSILLPRIAQAYQGRWPSPDNLRSLLELFMRSMKETARKSRGQMIDSFKPMYRSSGVGED